ncbi:hypothetical protein T492DRAFT_66668 [Pavlovales sp. CCMP2436]|nr:hypothetical protein T492DRAFT_66668 [Pavlovales sp. CCMP2436]
MRVPCAWSSGRAAAEWSLRAHGRRCMTGPVAAVALIVLSVGSAPLASAQSSGSITLSPGPELASPRIPPRNMTALIAANASAAAEAAAEAAIVEAAGLPPDVLQFLSLLAYQAILVAVHVVLFLALRPRWRRLFAPHRPDGPVGLSRSAFTWLFRVLRTTDTELREAGQVGVGGRPLGFSRLALTNLVNADAPDEWRRWVTVLAVWANALLAMRAADALDASVAEITQVAHARVSAPLHRYALVVTDLPKAATAKAVGGFFRAIFGPGRL